MVRSRPQRDQRYTSATQQLRLRFVDQRLDLAEIAIAAQVSVHQVERRAVRIDLLHSQHRSPMHEVSKIFALLEGLLGDWDGV